MPNIPMELQETPDIRPTEQGIEALTQSAYRGRSLYNQAGEAVASAGAHIGSGIASAGEAAVSYLDHQQINAGAAKGAEMLSNLTDSWNNTAKNADPNDPSVAKKWTEETLEPALESYEKGFLTQRSSEWGQRYIDSLRQHFFEKTSADMSTLAGVAVETNMHNIANNFSNTAIGDPSSVPFLLDNVDHQVDGLVNSSPNLKGAVAAKVRGEVSQRIKEEIVKSGVYGAIQHAADPEAAVAAWTKKYPDYVNGQEAEVFARQAKVQSRMLQSYGKANLLYQKQLDNQHVAAERNKIWSNNVRVDPSGKVTINPQFFRDAAKIPTLYPDAPQAIETAKTLLDWGERQQSGAKVTTDPATAGMLDDRMFDQEDPTSAIDILKAEAAGKLSRQDGEIRLQLAKARDAAGNPDPALTNALREARSYIEPFQLPSGGGGRFVGQNQNAAFQLAFMNEYQKEKAAGTLPANALDINDPKSLISQMMQSYRPPLAKAIMANGGLGIAAPQINQGPARKILTKAQYDALSSGTTFTGADGKTYRKP